MKSYTWEYLDLKDVCEHNKLDYHAVIGAICHSDVCFGTNADSLISQEMLQNIVDDGLDFPVVLDFGKHDNTVVISLGS